MKTTHYLSVLIIPILLATPLRSQTHSDWETLFNGKDFAGWTTNGGQAVYSVSEGAIVGTNGPGPNTFLCTEKSYGDFELEFEVKIATPLNSGVQIRSHVRDFVYEGETIKQVFGPQVEIEQSPGEAGYIYGEKMKGGWRTPEEDLITHQVFRNGEWNHYRIVARGARIQTYINGKQISDLVDSAAYASHPSGFIGLQVHKTKKPDGTLTVAWRNLRIREIDSKPSAAKTN